VKKYILKKTIEGPTRGLEEWARMPSPNLNSGTHGPKSPSSLSWFFS